MGALAVCSWSDRSLGRMRPEVQFLIALLVAIAGVFVTVKSPMLQAHPEVADYVLYGLGGLFILTSAVIFREPIHSTLGRLTHRPKAEPLAPAAPPADDWMTLADAARFAMDVEGDTWHAGGWRATAQSEEEMLRTWAFRVALQIRIPVYGSRAMSSIVERIRISDLEGGEFRDLVTKLDLRNDEPMNNFVNLKVKRSELESGLAVVRRFRQ